MKGKGIKNLLVDFGGVLINLNRQQCIDNFRKLGLPDIEKQLGLYAQNGLFMQHERGEISSAQFRDEIRKRIDKPVADAQIDAAWNSFLMDIPTYKLDLLLKLREKYVVYLLSNTNDIHWDWACENVFPYRGFRVEDYFEKIYLSYKMKMAKPDAEIFRAVLEDANIEPNETFFIDDSPANCETARLLGISTYTPQLGEDWSPLFA